MDSRLSDFFSSNSEDTSFINYDLLSTSKNAAPQYIDETSSLLQSGNTTDFSQVSSLGFVGSQNINDTSESNMSGQKRKSNEAPSPLPDPKRYRRPDTIEKTFSSDDSNFDCNVSAIPRESINSREGDVRPLKSIFRSLAHPTSVDNTEVSFGITKSRLEESNVSSIENGITVEPQHHPRKSVFVKHFTVDNDTENITFSESQISNEGHDNVSTFERNKLAPHKSKPRKSIFARPNNNETNEISSNLISVDLEETKNESMREVSSFDESNLVPHTSKPRKSIFARPNNNETNEISSDLISVDLEETKNESMREVSSFDESNLVPHTSKPRKSIFARPNNNETNEISSDLTSVDFEETKSQPMREVSSFDESNLVQHKSEPRKSIFAGPNNNETNEFSSDLISVDLEETKNESMREVSSFDESNLVPHKSKPRKSIFARPNNNETNEFSSNLTSVDFEQTRSQPMREVSSVDESNLVPHKSKPRKSIFARPNNNETNEFSSDLTSVDFEQTRSQPMREVSSVDESNLVPHKSKPRKSIFAGPNNNETNEFSSHLTSVDFEQTRSQPMREVSSFDESNLVQHKSEPRKSIFAGPNNNETNEISSDLINVDFEQTRSQPMREVSSFEEGNLVPHKSEPRKSILAGSSVDAANESLRDLTSVDLEVTKNHVIGDVSNFQRSELVDELAVQKCFSMNTTLVDELAVQKCFSMNTSSDKTNESFSDSSIEIRETENVSRNQVNLASPKSIFVTSTNNTETIELLGHCSNVFDSPSEKDYVSNVSRLELTKSYTSQLSVNHTNEHVHIDNNTFTIAPENNTYTVGSVNQTSEPSIVEKNNETFTAVKPVNSLDVLPIISSGVYNTDNISGALDVSSVENNDNTLMRKELLAHDVDKSNLNKLKTLLMMKAKCETLTSNVETYSFMEIDEDNQEETNKRDCHKKTHSMIEDNNKTEEEQKKVDNHESHSMTEENNETQEEEEEIDDHESVVEDNYETHEESTIDDHKMYSMIKDNDDIQEEQSKIDNHKSHSIIEKNNEIQEEEIEIDDHVSQSMIKDNYETHEECTIDDHETNPMIAGKDETIEGRKIDNYRTHSITEDNNETQEESTINDHITRSIIEDRDDIQEEESRIDNHEMDSIIKENNETQEEEIEVGDHVTQSIIEDNNETQGDSYIDDHENHSMIDDEDDTQGEESRIYDLETHSMIEDKDEKLEEESDLGDHDVSVSNNQNESGNDNETNESNNIGVTNPTPEINETLLKIHDSDQTCQRTNTANKSDVENEHSTKEKFQDLEPEISAKNSPTFEALEPSMVAEKSDQELLRGSLQETVQVMKAKALAFEEPDSSGEDTDIGRLVDAEKVTPAKLVSTVQLSKSLIAKTTHEKISCGTLQNSELVRSSKDASRNDPLEKFKLIRENNDMENIIDVLLNTEVVNGTKDAPRNEATDPEIQSDTLPESEQVKSARGDLTNQIQEELELGESLINSTENSRNKIEISTFAPFGGVANSTAYGRTRAPSAFFGNTSAVHRKVSVANLILTRRGSALYNVSDDFNSTNGSAYLTGSKVCETISVTGTELENSGAHSIGENQEEPLSQKSRRSDVSAEKNNKSSSLSENTSIDEQVNQEVSVRSSRSRTRSSKTNTSDKENNESSSLGGNTSIVEQENQEVSVRSRTRSSQSNTSVKENNESSSLGGNTSIVEQENQNYSLRSNRSRTSSIRTHHSLQEGSKDRSISMNTSTVSSNNTLTSPNGRSVTSMSSNSGDGPLPRITSKISSTTIGSGINETSSSTQSKRKKRALLSTSTLMEGPIEDVNNSSVKIVNLTMSAHKTKIAQRTNKLLDNLSQKSGIERELNAPTVYSEESNGSFKQPMLPERFSLLSNQRAMKTRSHPSADNHSRSLLTSQSQRMTRSLSRSDLQDSCSNEVLSLETPDLIVNKNSTKISSMKTSTVRKVKPNRLPNDSNMSSEKSKTASLSNIEISRIATSSSSRRPSVSRLSTTPAHDSHAPLPASDVAAAVSPAPKVRRRSSSLHYQTMDYNELSHSEHPEASILEKILFSELYDLNETCSTSISEAPSKASRKKNPNRVDIILENGEVYKPKKLFMHKKSPFVNKRLYKFLEKKQKEKYGLKMRLVGEFTAKMLHEKCLILQDRKHKLDSLSKEILEFLINKLTGLSVIENIWDFHVFCKQYLPPRVGHIAAKLIGPGKDMFAKIEYVDDEF